MKTFTLIIIAFLQIIFLSAQRDPLDNVFTVDQPLWSHVAMDSTAVGQKNRAGNYQRTGMDFYPVLSENKVLVDPYNPDFCYLVYDNSFDSHAGSFLEKINLRNGKRLWSNYFDLRNNDYREQTNRFFINNDGELELLGIKHDQDTVIFIWNSGKFSCRKYDTASGQLKYYWSAPRTNDDYPTMYQNRILNRIVKNDRDLYDFYSINLSEIGLKRKKQNFDEFGKLISVDSLEFAIKYRYVYLDSWTLWLPGDNGLEFVHLDHNFQGTNFVTGDSLSLIYYRFGENLKTIAKNDLSHQIKRVKQIGITNYSQDHAIIYTRDFDTLFRDNRDGIILLDKEGKLIEEIIFTGPWSDPFGKFSGAIKLKDEPGMLVLIESNNNPAPNRDRIYFYKTDGEGNMSLLKEIKVNTDYVPLLNYLLELENGDILWNALFRVRGGPSFIDDRTITSRWSRESLGLSSSGDHKKDNWMKVYPNPVKNELIISHPNFSISRIQMYDMEGRTCLNVDFSPSNEVTVSVANLPSAMYLVQAFGTDGQLIYTGKVMKE